MSRLSRQFLQEFRKPARKSGVEPGGHLVALGGTAALPLSTKAPSLTLTLKGGYRDFSSSSQGMVVKEGRFSSHLISEKSPFARQIISFYLQKKGFTSIFFRY